MNLQPNDRVLFIGDSITNAFRKPEEQNNAYQLGAGYTLLVASRFWLEHPDAGVEFLNRGVAGNRLNDLEDRWQTDCLALRPTVISILVGVNDTLHAFAGAGGGDQKEGVFEGAYHELLLRTQHALPEARLIILEPFLLPCGQITQEQVAHVRQLAQAARKVAHRGSALFVPLQEPFDRASQQAPMEFWSYDGIHPTAAGFALIAREWCHAVQATP